ncbi:MAG: AAA family ATPase [Fusicatenibacter sp.]|nr:AAA family ATPase [Fusicatenibacter sp.]
MKKLQKIRLINWHRFLDETIEMDESVLLSGENGAGKSTLLDAIQFVITCSKTHFNKAAHEKGKRNLNSYIRCKTGREDRPYERYGEISSHIALEFYDEARKQPFLVGAVMDSASEEKEPNAAWYLMEKQELSDELFLRGDQVKSISAFRTTNRKIRQFATTQTEAKKMMQTRFGRLEDKFFSLIPKALAFKPIHDIKDFVYSYVLDEKEVNIDALKENVRSYQDLDRMLQDVKGRIRELEAINDKEAEVENCLRIDRNHQYYLACADVELTEQEKEETKNRIRMVALRQQELTGKQQQLMDARQGYREMITNLSIELNSNADYQALHELERREANLKDMLEQDRKEVVLLKKAAKAALIDAQKLIQVRDTDPCILEYSRFLEKLDECESLVDVNLCLEKVISYKKKMYTKVQERLAELRVEQNNRRSELLELNNRIELLEKKRFTYPPEVTQLQRRIAEQLQQMGRPGEVRVLCELLEITNPAWQNAVEGYLNNQRFYLLVEPGDFDLALSVYDKMRENRKVYGAGLINTGKLEKYDQVPEGTLAEIVTSKSIWAKRYANMVLGRVQMCQRYQDLKRYPVAITRQCMRYQNHVVSAIRPEIYQTPYIGREAYQKQLDQCLEKRKKLQEQDGILTERIGQLERVVIPLDSSSDVDVKYRLSCLEDQRRHEKQLLECQRSAKKLRENKSLIQKQIHLQELEQAAARVDQEILAAENQKGKYAQEEIQQNERILELKTRGKEQEEVLRKLVERLGAEASACAREYERQKAGRDLQKFKESFERARKANLTIKEKTESEMAQLMRAYKVAHDFGAAESLEGYPEFQAEYEKLKNSQLLSYEEKVYKARQAAEEEFREQFLSKLQENIKQAQSEFKELNRSLKDIHFSREQYEFLYEPSKRLKRYYQMIMDDFNVLQGESIFSGMFSENHREVIEELFEKLAVDDENSAKTLEEYTDYRTYMDYDIKIQSDDGSYMLYSKVSQEKSGGETQTPFYITVAASFMQLYRNSIGGDAIGLVMLDEAFNNMDDERIAGVLEFMTHANLQIIIAAPPDKIQYIGPAVKKVLLVLQDDQVSYVEDFTRT